MPSHVSLRNRIPEIMAELPAHVARGLEPGTKLIGLAASERAPRGATGNLKASLRETPRHLGHNQLGIYAMWYWFFQEYGTVNASARPFVTPAVEGNYAALIRLVEEELKNL